MSARPPVRQRPPARLAPRADPRRHRPGDPAHRRTLREPRRERQLRDRHRRRQQQLRLDDAARRRSPTASTGRPASRPLVRRLATNLGGEVRLVSPDGTVLAAFGKTPDGTGRRRTPRRSRSTDVVVATLEADLPGRASATAGSCRCSTSRSSSAASSASSASRSRRSTSRTASRARSATWRTPPGGSGPARSAARATGGDDRESADLADSFNAMADRLERSEMLRRRAASDIAHDLVDPGDGPRLAAPGDGRRGRPSRPRGPRGGPLRRDGPRAASSPR